MKIKTKHLFYIGLVCIIILIIISLKGFRPGYTHQKVDVNDTLISSKKLLSTPISEIFESISVQEKSITYEIAFEKPIETSGFSIFFYGNLHATSTYAPKSFKVYYQDGNKLKLADEIRNNTKSYYQLNLDQNISTDKFVIEIDKAHFDNTVFMGNLKVLKLQKVTFIKSLVTHYKSYSKHIVWYFLLSVLFYMFLFFPGYAVISLLKTNIKSEFYILLSFVASNLILVLLSTAFVFTKLSALLIIYPVLVVVSIIYIILSKKMPALKSVKSILIITIIALFITTLLQATRDYIFNLNYIEKYLDTLDYIPITGGYYGYHADNTLPWGISKIFLDDVPIFSELARNYLFGFKGAAVLDRPPFLWLRTLPILKFFGDSHFTYQRFLTVMMTIYYPTIYILVKKILNKKVAILVTLITLINITLTYQVNNVEIYYKYIALIPLFLSLYLIINNTSIKKYIIGGFLLVVSYLIHPIAAVITPTIFIVYIFTNYNFKDFSFKKIIQKKFIINGLLYFLPIVLAFISWNLFTSWYIENHSPPEQVNENLYLEKLVEVNNKTVQNKIFNILNIFIPDILFRSVDPNHSPFFNFYLKFFRFSIISALSPLVFVFMFILGKKSFKLDRQTKLVLFVCGIFPIISFVLLLNPYSFGGYALLYPFCLPFLLAYALYLIQQTSKRTRLILYSSYIIYMIFPLIVISGIFTKIRYINPYIDLFKFILIAIYALISFYIIRFSMKS